MTLGLFDLPAPLLQWANETIIRWISVPVAIALWASLAAVICMELYRLFSPQQRIGEIQRSAAAARLQLAGYEGPLEDAWPLLKSMLIASFKRVGIVLPATLLSAYPVVALLIWMGNEYSYRFPVQGETVQVEVAVPLAATWIDSDIQSPHVQVSKPTGAVVMDVPVAAPTPILHKPVWWNILIANPAGYLPENAVVDEVRFDFPERKVIGWGPSWMRGWEVIFIPVLFVVALGYKFARGIH